MKHLEQLLSAIAIAASGSVAVFAQHTDESNLVPIDPEIRQFLTQTIEQSVDLAQFRPVVEALFRHNKYAEVAQIGEYLHAFYDFEKRKVFVPDFASVIAAEFQKIPEEIKPGLLQAVGRAAFVFDDFEIRPTVDLVTVTDIMLSAATSENSDIRAEAVSWLLRIARVDRANADRIRVAAEKRLQFVVALGDSPNDHELRNERKNLNGIILVAGYEKLTLFRDNEVPRTDDKSVGDLLVLLHESKSRVATNYREHGIQDFLRMKASKRTSPSEVVTVLQYATEEGDSKLLSWTLTSCFNSETKQKDESSKLAVEAIVLSLEHATRNPQLSQSILEGLAEIQLDPDRPARIKSGKVKPLFDAETSQKVFTLATGLWPMPEYESRVAVYRILLMLSKYGENIAGKIADFAKGADDFERTENFDDEKTRNRVLEQLKILLPPEAPQGN